MSFVKDSIYEFDYSMFNTLDTLGKYNLIKDGANLILSSEKNKRFIKHVLDVKNPCTLSNGILENDYKNKVLYIISVGSFISKISNENKLAIFEINKNVGIVPEHYAHLDFYIHLLWD